MRIELKKMKEERAARWDAFNAEMSKVRSGRSKAALKNILEDTSDEGVRLRRRLSIWEAMIRHRKR